MTTNTKNSLHIFAPNAKILATLTLLWVFALNGFAVTYYSRATGSWNANTTWSLTSGGVAVGTGVFPGAGDNVIIEGGDNVAVNIASPACANLTLGAAGNGTLTYNYGTNGGTFTVTGDVTILSGSVFTTSGSARTHTMYIGGNVSNAGTFYTYTSNNNYLNVVFNGSTQSISGNGLYYWNGVTVNSGSTVTSTTTSNIQIRTNATVTGTLDLQTGSMNRYAASGNTLTVTGLLRLGATTGGKTGSNFPNNFSTYTVTGGTVEYYSTSAQTVFDVTTNYGNLTLSGNSTKTTTGVAVDGVLSIEGTTGINAAITYGAASTLQYKLSTSRSTNSNELPGTFPGSGGIIVDMGANTITLHQNTTNNGNLNVLSGTLNLSTFTLNRSSAGGTFSIASGAQLQIGGTNTLPSNYSTHAVDCNSIINYNGSNQTVANLNSGQTYGHLSFNGSGTKTLQAGTSTICGNLSISATSTTAVTGLTIGGNMDIGASATFNAGAFTHIVRGNWTKTGTFTDTGSTIQFDGSSAQSIGTSNFNHLTFTSAGVKTATGALTINGNLTITSNFTHGDGLTHTVAGNYTNNGTYTPGTGTLTMGGTVKQDISGASATTFNNLVVDNTAGVQILNTAQISVTELTINSGKFIEMSSNIHLFANNIVNNAGTTGILLKSVVDQPFPTLIFNNSISSPIEATVELATKGNLTEGDYIWQFVGLPITEVHKSYPILSGSYMRQFNEAAVIGGAVTSPWTPVSLMMQAFRGYMITQASQRVIPFAGTLINQSQTLNLAFTASPVPTYQGLNLLANSFTAAVNIPSLVFSASVVEEVYLFNTGYRNSEQDPESESGENSGQYLVVPKATAGTLGLPGQISSMQAFFVQATAASQTLGMPYSSAVNQTVNLRAPKAPATEEFVGTRLTLHGKQTMDHLWLFSHPACTNAFDNGYDGNKMMGGMPSAQMYVSMTDRDYQVFTTNDYDQTDITFVPGADSVYTLRANHHRLDEKYPLGLYLVDLHENVVVNMTDENATYTFTANSADASSKRFRIVSDSSSWTSENELPVESVKIAVNDGKMIVLGGSGAMQLEVHDATGRMVYQDVLQGDGNRVVNHVFVRGTYVVKAVSATNRIVQKVIVK